VKIDQRDIQRIGGKAAEYPSSYVVVKLLEKHNLFSTVLDVTYGRGRFYYFRKPSFLIGADPKPWDWVVTPDIFIPRPVWQLFSVLNRLCEKPSVLVCDPPQWNPDVHYHKREEYSYILGSSDLIISESVNLAKQLGIEYLLLHFNKRLDLNLVDEIEFQFVARFLNNPVPKTTYFSLYKI